MAFFSPVIDILDSSGKSVKEPQSSRATAPLIIKLGSGMGVSVSDSGSATIATFTSTVSGSGVSANAPGFAPAYGTATNVALVRGSTGSPLWEQITDPMIAGVAWGKLTGVSIVNADISTGAAISLGKIAPGSAAQIVGITAGTATWENQGYIDHGSISGLSDDDHPQYARVDGATQFLGITIAATATSPTIKQATRTTGADGSALTVKAQDTTYLGSPSGKGGDLVLSSGVGGTTNDGLVRIFAGATEVINFSSSNGGTPSFLSTEILLQRLSNTRIGTIDVNNSNGHSITIEAQNTTFAGAVGGNLVLKPGGGATPGTILLNGKVKTGIGVLSNGASSALSALAFVDVTLISGAKTIASGLDLSGASIVGSPRLKALNSTPVLGAQVLSAISGNSLVLTSYTAAGSAATTDVATYTVCLSGAA